MVVAVGSTNPTKIAPVKEIFSHHFPGVVVKGVKVPSGVDEQPMHEDRIFEGALNRAKRALDAVPGAAYGVGIEGGLHKYSFGWIERALVVIINTKGEIGVGSSGGLVVPDKIVKKIHKGHTLGSATDELFKTKNIGEGIGMFGLMTKGVVTRSDGNKHAVAFALSRFLHEAVYTEK